MGKGEGRAEGGDGNPSSICWYVFEQVSCVLSTEPRLIINYQLPGSLMMICQKQMEIENENEIGK